MAQTTHIVFGEAGGIELRDALRQVERDDRVLEFPDDLGFGPIAPADPVARAQWVAEQMGEPQWREIVPQVEAFWAAALSGTGRHVVWFSRRVARDYCGFLEYLWRIGDRPCDVVDLTDAMVPVRAGDGSLRGSIRAICASFTEAYQFLETNLFAQGVSLSDDARASYRAEWERLRAENASLRIVADELRLVSAPLSSFDDMLLKAMQGRFLKAARIIGTVLVAQWDSDIYNASDFFLSRRLLALSRAGVIESQGDLRRIGYSEVRLPGAALDE